MIRLALLFVLALQVPVPPPPAPPDPIRGTMVQDTLEVASPEIILEPPSVEPRGVPEAALEELRANPEFQYDDPEAETPSLWDRFWMWVARTFLQPIGDGVTSKPMQVGLMAFAAVAFLWILVRFLRGEGSGLFGRKDTASPEVGELLLDVEDIESVDLGSRLADAIRDGDHRAAVRLRYLLALQQLAQSGHIEWARDKTNRTYVVETRQSAGADVGRAFADVTRVFDYVWYGGLSVDAARYARFEGRFDQLDAQLASSSRVPSRRSVSA
ncbi:MAG: hypothetical protein Rubg2KO_27640 [Rubricoccaceae bacterium]